MQLLEVSGAVRHIYIQYMSLGGKRLHSKIHGAHVAFVCFVRISGKQRLLPYTTLADWFCITEVESVYSAVRTESLYRVFHDLRTLLQEVIS